MFKHVVMWKLKSVPQGREKSELLVELRDALNSLNGKIPGVIKIEAGINTLEGEFSYDLLLVGTYSDKEAFENYKTHPEHEAILPLFKGLELERAVVDY
jgi:hypothetical protein